MHGRPGKITAIRDHEDGKHAEVTVTHGKKKRSKSSDGQPGELMGYHRPESRVTIPKQHAANYAIGQKVNAGIGPVDDEDMEDGGDDEAAEGEAPMQGAPKGKAPAKKAAPKGKANKKGKSNAKAPPSRIQSAMAQC